MVSFFYQLVQLSKQKRHITSCRNEDWRKHEENFRKGNFGLSKHLRVGEKSRVEGKIEMGDTGRRSD